MSMIKMMVVALVALSATMLVGTSSARAQTAEQIVQRAKDDMRAATGRAVDAIRGAAHAAVARVEQLDQGGATADQIKAAGREGQARVSEKSQQGHAAVRAIAQAALDALKAINADRRYGRAVQEAAEVSRRVIQEGTDRGHREIARAVWVALH